MAHGFIITDGPSKFDLLVALTYGDAKHRISVSFVFRPEDQSFAGDHATATVNMLERSGADGEEWLIEGRIHCRRRALTNQPYKGNFNTQHRDGRFDADIDL